MAFPTVPCRPLALPKPGRRTPCILKSRKAAPKLRDLPRQAAINGIAGCCSGACTGLHDTYHVGATTTRGVLNGHRSVPPGRVCLRMPNKKSDLLKYAAAQLGRPALAARLKVNPDILDAWIDGSADMTNSKALALADLVRELTVRGKSPK